MPPAKVQTDPDHLMRGAIAGVAVAAYARGINIIAHVDNRMPNRLIPEADDLDAFLRRGMQRTVDGGRTVKIAIALWVDEIGADGGVRASLEVGRALEGSGLPASRLADLWTLPLDGATVHPVTGRQDAAAETVLIPLRFRSRPGAPTAATRWDDVFAGRRLMLVRDGLIDRDRLRASLAAIDAEPVFAATVDEALAVLRAEADAGRPIDVMALDGCRMGSAAITLARQVRAEPALASTRIVLASALRGTMLAADDPALFDVAPWAAAPWRRLLDVLCGLFRSGVEPRQAAGRAGARTATGVGPAIPALAGWRILIAGDVATNQVLMQAMLQPTGAEVELVGDGMALLRRHRAAPADLILMDLQMPGMGGIAATRHLRALDGAAAKVPVVALTAHARRADRDRALDAGMDAYLAKPVVVAEFYELLRKLLPESETADR